MKKRNSILIFAVLLLVAGSAFAAPASPSLGGEELPAPTITINPDIYYPMDEILYIEGRAEPLSTVQVQFTKSGLKPLALNSKSDANGEWVLAEKVPLEAGEWEVRARILQSSGKTSPWSNPRVVKAISTGVVIGGLTFKFAAIILVVSLLLILSISLILYFYFRMRRYQSRVYSLKVRELEKKLAEKTLALEKTLINKEKEAAETAVGESFADIRRAILDELAHIEAATPGKILSPEEEEHKTRLMNTLKEVESKIGEKIKNIDHEHAV